MNIEEYINQDSPRRGVKVDLKDEDYVVWFSWPEFDTSECERRFYNIKVNAYPEYTYLLKGESGVLWSTDSDGNPKSPSVFYIEKLKQNGKD